MGATVTSGHGALTSTRHSARPIPTPAIVPVAQASALSAASSGVFATPPLSSPVPSLRRTAPDPPQALREQRARVDNRWGVHTRRWNGLGDTLLQHSYTHINLDLKGEQMRAERVGKINSDNQRLVTHMEQIMSRPPGDLALHSCDEAHGRGGAEVFVARLRRSPQTFCSLETAWATGGINGGHPELMQHEESESAGSSSPEERAARPTTAPSGGGRSSSPSNSSSLSTSGLPPPWKVHSAEINRRRKLAQIEAENAALVQRLAACRPLLSRAPWGSAGGPPPMPALTWAARVAQANCRPPPHDLHMASGPHFACLQRVPATALAFSGSAAHAASAALVCHHECTHLPCFAHIFVPCRSPPTAAFARQTLRRSNERRDRWHEAHRSQSVDALLMRPRPASSGSSGHADGGGGGGGGGGFGRLPPSAFPSASYERPWSSSSSAASPSGSPAGVRGTSPKQSRSAKPPSPTSAGRAVAVGGSGATAARQLSPSKAKPAAPAIASAIASAPPGDEDGEDEDDDDDEDDEDDDYDEEEGKEELTADAAAAEAAAEAHRRKQRSRSVYRKNGTVDTTQLRARAEQRLRAVEDAASALLQAEVAKEAELHRQRSHSRSVLADADGKGALAKMAPKIERRRTEATLAAVEEAAAAVEQQAAVEAEAHRRKHRGRSVFVDSESGAIDAQRLRARSEGRQAEVEAAAALATAAMAMGADEVGQGGAHQPKVARTAFGLGLEATRPIVVRISPVGA